MKEFVAMRLRHAATSLGATLVLILGGLGPGAAPAAAAAEPPLDLSIVSVGGDNIAAGEPVQLTLTATNSGPTALSLPASAELYFTTYAGEWVTSQWSVTGDCEAVAAGGGPYIQTIYAVTLPSSVPAGEVFTCAATYVPNAGDVADGGIFGTWEYQSGIQGEDYSFWFYTLAAPGQPSNPVVSGTPAVGSTLTVTPGYFGQWDQSYSYQWLRAGAVIGGATDSTYTLTQADQGAAISVRVVGATEAGGGGSTIPKTSAPTAPVTGNSPPVQSTATPTIPAASPVVGQSIATTGGSWNPADVTKSFQWTAAGTNIPGATSASYTPTNADVGKPLAVKVTGSKSGFTSTTATSNVTGAVVAAPVPIVNTKLPSISGTAQVGKVVQAGGGNWSGAPTSYAYLWYRDGSPIAKAIGQKYAVTAADAGKRISVRVTASRVGTPSVSATSKPSALVAKGTLTLSGRASIAGTGRVGKTLTAKRQTCTPAAAITYQWLRSGKPVAGAKKATYKVVRADKGKTISVRVTYKRAGYGTVSRTIPGKKIR